MLDLPVGSTRANTLGSTLLQSLPGCCDIGRSNSLDGKGAGAYSVRVNALDSRIVRVRIKIMNAIELALGVVTGIALSATCGMRVFVPVFGVSIAALTGHLDLADGLAWLGSPVVAISAGVAMLAEIVAFYVPWLDNALDGIAAPLAVAAGTILTASQIHDVSPYLQWRSRLWQGVARRRFFKPRPWRCGRPPHLGPVASPILSFLLPRRGLRRLELSLR